MTQFPRAEFGDRLDHLLAAASRAGISAHEIETELQARINAMHARAIANVNLGTTPTMFDGHGKRL